METVVRCSPRFLQTLVLATVESYHFGTGERVSKGGYRSREIYGHIWGYSRVLGGDEPLRFLHFDFLNVSLSARRKLGQVSPNEDFSRTSHDIVGRLSPELHMLGDFHTHPHPESSVGDVLRDRLYDFSDPDIDSFLLDDLLWEAADDAPVMTVATICKLQRVPETWEAKSLADNVVQFDVGQFRIWFNVFGGFTHRVYPDDELNLEMARSYTGKCMRVDLESRIGNSAENRLSLRRDD